MIYLDLPFPEYLELPGISMSRLKAIQVSPAHFLSERQNKDSPAKELGRLFDCLVTTPHLFDSHYFVCEAANKRTKAYEAQVAEAKGREIVDIEDVEKAKKMKAAVDSHSICQGLLNGAQTQLSVTWEHSIGAIPCKGRPDIYLRELELLVDLKTTQDARPWAFASSAEKFSYFHQLEFYRQGLIANDMPVSKCLIIAVETVPPYQGIQIFELSEPDLDSAAGEIEEWLRKYKHCIDTNQYPCYPEVVEVLRRPTWATKEKL